MTIDMSQFYQVFFEETAEHLANMENLLLALDVDNPSLDDLNAIFRAAHSIKGGSGTFGFSDMTEVTHVLETLLDRLRKQELQLRPEMVDAFLAAGDVLRAQLEHHQGGADADPAQVALICATLADLASGKTPAAPAPAPTPAAIAPPAETRTLRLECSLPTEATADHEAVENLLAALADLAACEVMQRPSASDAQLVVRLETSRSNAELKDVFSFHLDPEAILICADDATEGYAFFDQPAAVPITADSDSDSDPGYVFFDVEPAAPDAATFPPACEEGDGYGLFAGAPGSPPPAGQSPAPKPASIAEPRAEKPITPPPAKATEGAAGKPAAAATASEASSIRVAVEKVDQLVNLVGELVITQAMLAEAAGHLDPGHAEKLLSGIELLARNTRDLQESVMSIRMLPMSMVFSRFPRLVHDLASKLGKQVELKTLGEGTELDKGLIEKIVDPLTHLVRNSLDHGIESAEKRITAGKNPMGALTLKASHQGGNIVIEVMDDGGGLDRERILAKAREKGLNVHDGMSDNEIWQFIMAPGFSTAETVTDVSGRGVGMDVVKQNIEALGGRVELDSSPGHGTRTIIRLPLTLAILDGMSVDVGGETFIIPLTVIVESLQPVHDEIKSMAGDTRVVHIRGEYLPLIPLAEVFGLPGEPDPASGIMVVVEAEEGKAALFVDALLGQQQVVIKSLEANYRRVPGISGATILGDGRVAMILDVAAITRLGLANDRRRKAA